MIEHFTPSDLIYLYLDGEASTTQQTTLFAALATDTDLQEEFNEALSMNKAFEHERAMAQPPSYLTERVFNTNGIPQAAATGSALATTFWLLMKKFGAPAASTAVGAAIMYVALQWGWGSENTSQQQTPLPSASVPASSQLAFAREERLTPPELVHQGVQGSDMPMHNNQNMGIAPHRRAQGTQHNAQQNIAEGSTTESTTLSSTQAQGHQDETIAEWDGDYRREELPFLSAPLYNDYAQGNQRLYGISALQANELIGTNNSKFTIQANSPLAVSLYNNPTSSSVNAFNTISASLFYNLSDDQAIGVEVGSRAVAVADVVNNTFVSNPTYMFYGVTYQYKADADFLGGQPFFQTSLGSTFNGGPSIGSLLPGISYSLWSSLRLNVGVEANCLLYNSLSNNNKVTKAQYMMGLTTAVSMSF